jgi:hypothetical protein
MEIWHLDSRSLYRLSPVNDYEQKIKQLIEASPSWEKDGGGVRGRTLAPLLGGASGLARFDDFAPQQFNQQNTQLSFSEGQPDEGLVLSAPTGSEPIPHPWQILLRIIPETNPPQYEAKIESASLLYKEIGSFDNISVDNIGTWEPAGEGFIILEVEFADGEADSAEVLFKEANKGNAVTFVSGEQTKFRYSIGYLYRDESNSLLLRQDCFGQLALVEICVSGKPAQYPISI